MSMFLSHTLSSLSPYICTSTFPSSHFCLCFSWGHDHEFQAAFFSLHHLDTWHLLSLSPHNMCLWYAFLSSHRAGENRHRDIVSSHPGPWCEVRHVVRTSTLLGRSPCTDTWAGDPGRRSWSRYLQYGRRTEYPGHYSDLGEKEIRSRI